MSKKSDEFGCAPIIAGCIMGAVVTFMALKGEVEKSKELQSRVNELESDFNEVSNSNQALQGQMATLQRQVEAADARTATAEANIETLKETHQKELTLVEQKATFEARLAGIEEGKAIAKSLIEQLVADKEQSAALVAKLNEHVQSLVDDLTEQLASVENLVADQSDRVSGFGYFTILLIVVAIALATVLAFGAWGYIRQGEELRTRFTVGAVLTSGTRQNVIMLPPETPRQQIIGRIENDLGLETKDIPTDDDFTFEAEQGAEESDD